MKKKIIALCLVICLLAIAVVGGTMAYLMDSDAKANTMTMGSVDIEQIEQERGANGQLVDFNQSHPLFPAVFTGSFLPYAPAADWVVPNDEAWKIVEENENVLDKFVTVENIGKSAAYIRTIVLYEGDVTYGPHGAYIHVVHNGDNAKLSTPIDIEELGYVTIKGTTYTIFCYTYQDALAAGATSIPSLKQVYMNKAATNDVVAHYGTDYDILVLSQAVQTAGFDSAADALNTAFGAVNATNVATWFDGIAPDHTVNP